MSDGFLFVELPGEFTVQAVAFVYLPKSPNISTGLCRLTIEIAAQMTKLFL